MHILKISLLVYSIYSLPTPAKGNEYGSIEISNDVEADLPSPEDAAKSSGWLKKCGALGVIACSAALGIVGDRSTRTGTVSPFSPPEPVKWANAPVEKSRCISAQEAGSDGALVPRKFCLTHVDDFNTLDFATWKHEISLGGGMYKEFSYRTRWELGISTLHE
jgi:hypothetical protein